MNHQTFDERMRKQVQAESFTPSVHAQQRLQQAMRKGAAVMGRNTGRIAWRRIMAYTVVAAMAAAVILVIQPPSDQWNRSAVTSEHLTAPTPIPVTVPEAFFEVSVSNRMLNTKATFSNHTGDIWLIKWNAEPAISAQDMKEPTDLIWLETGITFRDDASWKLAGGWNEQTLETEWDYTAYRVADKMLHWIEGEWLLPGSEGYEEQQMLIEDAFVNGALILSPGDWPDGTSGEMQLVLPDSFQKEHPEMDPLTYYAQKGLLIPDAQGQGVASAHP
ncbi:MAG: hypothetical protein J6K55_08375 [Clostridia bacterium]|nr:hypothetical protein [Clostridia bacterium]